MSIDVSHLARRDACVAECHLHGSNSTVALWMRLGDVISVSAQSVANDFPVDLCPSRKRVVSIFQDKHASALSCFEDIIIQLLMERLNISAEQMARRHTNLDGYMEFNED